MLGALLCVLSIFGPISRVSVNGLHYTAGAIPYRASENGINHAQDNGVSWDGLEVFPAQAQRVAQVGKVDLANDKGGRDAKQLQFGSCEYCGHSSRLLVVAGERSAPKTRAPAPSAKIAIEPGKSGSTRKSFAG